MGAHHRTYHKIPCDWCKRDIGRNAWGRHRKVCPSKPPSEMTFGELLNRFKTVEGVNEAIRKEPEGK